MSEKGSGSTFLEVMLSFTLGAVAGAVVALLYAPQTGDETRDKLRELSDEYSILAKEKYGKARKSIDSNVQKIKSTKNKIAKKGKK